MGEVALVRGCQSDGTGLQLRQHFRRQLQGLNCSGMTVPEAKRLRELDTENARPKKPLAESMLEIEITREAL